MELIGKKRAYIIYWTNDDSRLNCCVITLVKRQTGRPCLSVTLICHFTPFVFKFNEIWGKWKKIYFCFIIDRNTVSPWYKYKGHGTKCSVEIHISSKETCLSECVGPCQLNRSESLGDPFCTHIIPPMHSPAKLRQSVGVVRVGLPWLPGCCC